MFSKHIIKQSISSNWKLWAILTGALMALTALVLFAIINQLNQTDINDIPEIGVEMILGMAFLTPTGTGGLLMLILAIVIGNKLVAREVDTGSMSFVLNTQTTRKQILFSKALVYFCMFLLFAVLVSLVAISVASTSNVFKADMKIVSKLALGFLLYSFAISSFCFAASCWFNKVSFSLLFGAGIPVLFTILGMIGGGMTGNIADFLKSITITTLFDTKSIVDGGDVAVKFVVLAIFGIVLYTVGIIRFLKKDLPL